MDVTPYSLSAFNLLVKQAMEQSFPSLCWIMAEIGEISFRSGHCYMELIEKETNGEHIIAKARANIWSHQFRIINPYFVSTTGRELAAGLKVMLQCKVAYHELYGFSLVVVDINPTYTVGELALKKAQILKKLEVEGVIDMNRELKLPLVAQRIAVISSPQAAGYGDFVNQLVGNQAGYRFEHTLFPAIMQGKDAESSVITALERIFERDKDFDVVVIIRGGGSQSDLHCFNSYAMAAAVAQFPLPVITGIGHDRDETIADRVANTPLKTPTAVAEFLIGRAAAFDARLQALTDAVIQTANEAVAAPLRKVNEQSQRLYRIMQAYVGKQDQALLTFQLRLQYAVNNYITEEKEFHRHAEIRLSLSDPVRLLERGYTLTLADGKIVRSANALREGQVIETRFHDGTKRSRLI